MRERLSDDVCRCPACSSPFTASPPRLRVVRGPINEANLSGPLDRVAAARVEGAGRGATPSRSAADPDALNRAPTLDTLLHVVAGAMDDERVRR